MTRFCWFRLSLPFTLLLLSAGCGTGGTTLLVPIGDGREHVRVELVRGETARVKGDGFEIQSAGFVLNPAPKLPDFIFMIRSVQRQAVQKITVDDITDEQPLSVLIDDRPTFSGGQWSHILPGVTLTDPRFAWVSQMNNEIRVYRFRITLADARSVVLDQATNYPAFKKTAIRTAFGEKL